MTNAREAINWLAYTYLYVRMLRAPDLYGISQKEFNDDKRLVQRRADLIQNLLPAVFEYAQLERQVFTRVAAVRSTMADSAASKAAAGLSLGNEAAAPGPLAAPQQSGLASLLSGEMGNSDKLTGFISEAKEVGIDVLPPSVNESIGRFNAVQDGSGIRFGMAAIKGVGEGVVEEIVKERDKNGPFAETVDRTKHVAWQHYTASAMAARWETYLQTMLNKWTVASMHGEGAVRA